MTTDHGELESTRIARAIIVYMQFNARDATNSTLAKLLDMLADACTNIVPLFLKKTRNYQLENISPRKISMKDGKILNSLSLNSALHQQMIYILNIEKLLKGSGNTDCAAIILAV